MPQKKVVEKGKRKKEKIKAPKSTSPELTREQLETLRSKLQKKFHK